VTRLLRSRVASMAFGSLIFQGAGFVIILALKGSLEAQGFAYFITQLAWAGIFGSVATFRLELLLFQEKGCVDRPSLITTLIFCIGILALIGIVFSVSAAVLGRASPLSWVSLLLAFGFALHEAQSFLCVQMTRIPELILTRIAQSIGLMITGYIGWAGQMQTLGIILLYGLAIMLPILIWFVTAIIRAEGPTRFHFPSRKAWGRSLYLVIATLVNTVYVNLAILIAGATQSPALVADFGFVMKLLTGPISLIRQAFGHTFMVDAFAIDHRMRNARGQFHTLLNRTIISSLKTYLLILIPVFLFLWFTSDIFGIIHAEIILWMSLASIAQVMVNPINGVRTPLQRELSFLLFDFMRTILLAAALLVPLLVPFEITFSVVSALLYGSYSLFIRHQVNHIGD